MGQLTFTARLSATEVYKGQVTVSDADVTRVIDAYRSVYYPSGIDGSPATAQQVVLAIANGLISGMIANVVVHEKSVVKDAAEATVVDLVTAPAQP